MTKRGPGKPAHEPTGRERGMVSAMVAYGMPQTEIATSIDISVTTLHKHYRNELDNGKAKANSTVAQALFNNAVKNNNVTAQIFWMKTQARWTETAKIEVIKTTESPLDLSTLTKSQRDELERLLELADQSEGIQDKAGPAGTDSVH